MTTAMTASDPLETPAPTPTPARLRRTGAAVAATALVAGLGMVFAAFSATTSNAGNSLSTGSVAIEDNDGGATAPMYTKTGDGNLAPGQTIEKCIQVTYRGSLGSAVKLYATTPITNGDRFTVQVERGTQTTGSFPGCGNFAATSTAFATADLSSFPATYAAGVDGKAAAATWAKDDVVAYRFTLTAKDGTAPNGNTTAYETSDHVYTWEARG